MDGCVYNDGATYSVVPLPFSSRTRTAIAVPDFATPQVSETTIPTVMMSLIIIPWLRGAPYHVLFSTHSSGYSLVMQVKLCFMFYILHGLCFGYKVGGAVGIIHAFYHPYLLHEFRVH